MCVCGLLPRIEHETPIVIVRHHQEARKPTNTARWASMVLADCSVLDWHEKQPLPETEVPRGLVLHPGASRVLRPEDVGTPLWVPDGTWHQAKRLLRRVPALLEAPLAKLPEVAVSDALRDGAERQGKTSTYEAIAGALGVLEGSELEQAMLRPFRTIVDRCRFTRGRLPRERIRDGLVPKTSD